MINNDPVIDGLAAAAVLGYVGCALSYCLGRGLDFVTLFNRPLNADDENEPLSALPFTRVITPVGVLASTLLLMPYAGKQSYEMGLHTLQGRNDYEASVSPAIECPQMYPAGLSKGHPAPDSVLRQYSGNFATDVYRRFTVPLKPYRQPD